MQGYGEVETTALDLEDLLSISQQRNKKKTTRPKEEGASMKSRKGNFPLTTLIIVMLVIALGTMVTVLKAEITSLKSDLSDLKTVKAQIAALDPKMEIASLETKMDTKFEKKMGESAKEQERIKTEIAQIMANVEALKVVKQQPPQRKTR
jgi:hypothetical protein